MKPQTSLLAARTRLDNTQSDPQSAAEPVFDTAEQALQWAVEVLRRRRLPRVSPLWNEMVRELDAVEQAWSGTKNHLIPRDADARLGLALTVMGALERLDPRDTRLLTLWSMGDWADDGRLRAALALQEKLRREGVRVRISYRYTYEQVGVAAQCDKKTAWRKIKAALERLGAELVRQGVVAGVEAPDTVEDMAARLVVVGDFGR